MENQAVILSGENGHKSALPDDRYRSGPNDQGHPVAAVAGTAAGSSSRAVSLMGWPGKADEPRNGNGAGTVAPPEALLPARQSNGAGRGGAAPAGYAEQIRRLKRFLSPQVARFILSCDERELLECQRREITVAFCHLRNFTAFSETAAPEDALDVLRQYHQALGPLITAFDGTLERFTGDGMMVYFDQPQIEQQATKALHMALRMRERVATLCASWRQWGYDLDFGMGIALGFASLGALGFEGRYDYGAIGPVTNLASRLCDHAKPGQILISQRLYAIVEDKVEVEPLGNVALGGFHSPMAAYSVRGLAGGAPRDPAA